MSEIMSAVEYQDRREEAFVAFKNLVKYNRTPSDYIPDMSFYNYLDSEMLNAIQKECGFVPPFLEEQSRLMQTSIGLEGIFDSYVSMFETDQLVTMTMLPNFIYNYGMIDKLIADQTSKDESAVTLTLPIHDEMMINVFGELHSTLKKKVINFIKKQRAINKWTRSTKFEFQEVIELRERFFQENLSTPNRDLLRHILTVYTQKGGSGKSHVSVSLAGALAFSPIKNSKVLVIDTDYQMSSSEVLGKLGTSGSDYADKPSVFDLLKAYADLDPTPQALDVFREKCASAVIKTPIPNVDLLPASDKSDFDANYVVGNSSGGTNIRPDALLKVIDSICEVTQYDYIIIDTRPDTCAAATLSYYACNQQLAIAKATGTDSRAFTNFVKRLARDVVPRLISRTDRAYTSPVNSKIIFNQFSPKVGDNLIAIQKFDIGLSASNMFTRSNVVITTSTATTQCSANDTSIWNPAKDAVSPTALKATRNQFQQLALEIIDEQCSLKENK
ncbi:ParA family protein [Vibrio coralliirubri]|uniref:ParA family protein n=1 Tax=Vibrio coralliirubri TaxID=1516159 RepID=UPI002283ABC0|nr:ParA family protein [Vibrio coralliirubri]MCY9866100.1 ParA family protein [Vibrio coralliirubri]